MPRFGLMGCALVALVLSACSGDAISPTDTKTPTSVDIPKPQLSGEAAVCTAQDISNHLTTLMAGLVPNDNSTLGKFQYVQTLLGYNNPDSTAKARDFTVNTIIGFITLKYGQASPSVQAQYAAQFEQVKSELLCFVGLFTIPKTNTPKVVVTKNQLMGIWFPEGFCGSDCEGINVQLDVLTACTDPDVPGNPVGCTPAPFGTLLDLYGNYLKVTLSGDVAHQNMSLDAIVGICAPSDLGDLTALNLRVVHQNDGSSNTAGFQILTLVALPSELDAVLLCDSYASNDVSGSRPGTMFARMMNGIANFLLPEKASANPMFLGGLGYGGTTKTFSPLGLASTTLSATGFGGTKTTFSPANPDAAPSAPADPNVSLAGTAGTQQNSGLPSVTVTTTLGTPIPGATVTFSLSDPTNEGLPYKNSPSLADICPNIDPAVPTDANGQAALPCIDFGTKAGYRDLKATINPKTAASVIANGGIDNLSVRACTDGVCGTSTETTDIHWLVQTNAAAASQLVLTTSPGTPLVAGNTFSPQPIVEVRDQYGNVVTTWATAIAVGATGPTGATGGLTGVTSPVPTNGVATFSGLGLGGTAGQWTLNFTSGTLTSASAIVQVTAGAASQILTYLPLVNPVAAATFTYTTGLTPGSAVSPAPRVIVRDTYNNPVSGVALSWTPPNGANGFVLNDAGGTSTGADGTAQVTSWTLGDGLNEVFANITALPNGTPATFSATTPTGQSIFACTIGTSKQDLVPFSVKRPTNSATKEVTLQMSVTGQSSYTAGYEATLKVFETASAFQAGTGAIATKIGNISLPGNNGNPTPVTFSFGSSIPKGSGLLYFRLSINAPGTRKFQLWYAASGFANNSDCANALMYTGFPNLTTPTPTKGLRIQLTN